MEAVGNFGLRIADFQQATFEIRLPRRTFRIPQFQGW